MSTPTKEQYLKAIADELHKPVRRVKERRTVQSSFKDEIWSMDLVEMGEWKAENDGEKYLLTIVDVFTRYAWARPMLTKTANDCFAAFIDVVESSKRKPSKIWVDQGAEFYNSTFKKWMASQKPPVIMYSTFGESKSVIVERFNRTLKTKMWYYFTEKNTRRWVDVLPTLMHWYNTRIHKKLGMSPWEASKKKNVSKVEAAQAAPVVSEASAQKGVERKPKFAVGDVVRISRIKGVFEKGYLPGWSREVFTVVEVQVPFALSSPITYKLQDRTGQVLQGSFYNEELQKVKYPDILLVESVLKEKKIGKEKHYLVKFLGYNSSMNTWLPESQLEDFKKPKYEVVSTTNDKIKLKRI